MWNRLARCTHPDRICAEISLRAWRIARGLACLRRVVVSFLSSVGCRYCLLKRSFTTHGRPTMPPSQIRYACSERDALLRHATCAWFFIPSSGRRSVRQYFLQVKLNAHRLSALCAQVRSGKWRGCATHSVGICDRESRRICRHCSDWNRARSSDVRRRGAQALK